LEPEGFIDVNGFTVFFRSEGEPARGSVLGLHGGPGGTYDYLSPLFDLANHGYRVVLYDQSGGGKSQAVRDPVLFTIERFVEEAEGVRQKLKLGKVHLYGHSWGGMLAQAYALKYQRNLVSLTLSGTTPSAPLFEKEAARIVRTLPADVRKKIAKYESEGDFDNPEYTAAVDVFNQRHQCLLDPWPATLKYTFSHFSPAVGKTMFGPDMVAISGNMRYWDVTELLSGLKIPTLVICGDRDFLTPRLHRVIHNKIRNSKLVILKGASHASMWEARESHIRAVASFLDSVK
jgi:proline iminopeptidase